MTKTVKQLYLPPSVLIFWVQLESGIAAASATVSGGSQGSPYTPQVDDYNADEDIGSRLGEF